MMQKRSDGHLPPGMPALPDAVNFPEGFSIDVFSWLDDYVLYSNEVSPEGYNDFHTFCGLWVLSVVAARRICLPFKMKRIYTNLLIALCSKTSMFAKTTTVNAARELLTEAGLNFFLGADRSSPQKLLMDMADATLPDNYPVLPTQQRHAQLQEHLFVGQRGLYYDEFGKLLKEMGRARSPMTLLTDFILQIEACPPEFSNATIQRGLEPIQNPYLALIGSMTPANLRDLAKAGGEFWQDGFWARFCLIAPPANQYKDCPWDSGNFTMPSSLITRLQNWHEQLGLPEYQLAGTDDATRTEHSNKQYIRRGRHPQHICSIAPDAEMAWKRYRSALKAMLRDIPHSDFHGSYERLPTTALRIAILNASLEHHGDITLKHWARAQELTERLRLSLHELYNQINRQDTHISSLEQSILTVIERLNQPVNARILQRHSSHLSHKKAAEIDACLISLTRKGYLTLLPHSTPKKYALIAR